MSERLSADMPQITTRQEYVENYIHGLSKEDTAVAVDVANQIFKREQPLANCQVLIPVAAHQESGQIGNALAQYAAQETQRPFSVVLSLNSPVGQQNNSEVVKTITEVQKAQQAFPWLDVRMAVNFYQHPTIGMIRRNLWNGALLASTYSGAYDSVANQEIIGINHDIDTVSISPRYIGRIQQYYAAKEAHYKRSGLLNAPLPSRGTLVRHALDSDYPNISKAVFWTDFIYRASKIPYENGLVFPFSHYASAGGFVKSDVIGEAHALNKNSSGVIAGTVMQTSPRRYIDRLSQQGFANIWTKDSFGAEDSCRAINSAPDLTALELDDIMLRDDYLKDSITILIDAALYKYVKQHDKALNHGEELSTDEVHDMLRRMFEITYRQINLGARVIGSVMMSEVLLTHLDEDLFDNDAYVDSIVSSYFPQI